jgi:hypothetical protein
VWDEALAGHLGAGSTGNALNAAGAAGDPWATAIPGAYGAGSAGLLLGTTIPAAIDAIDNYVDAEIGALATAVADVPTVAEFEARSTTDPATQTLLTTVAGYLDTEIAAIKAVTDALTAAAAAKLALSAGTIVSAAAAAGTLSTTEMTTNLTEATDDHYNGRIIIWTSGVLQNQATDITDYDGATKKLVYTAVTEAPTAADTFIIV